MTSLQITLGGIEVLNRQLIRFISQVEDMQPALEDVARMLTSATKENFSSEGASGPYGRWAPLSPAYREWKERHYPGQPILVRTGALRKALTGYPMQVQKTTRTSLVLGTDVTYAIYHQTGTPKMPRRPPIALTEQMRRDMVKIIQKFAVRGRD